MDLNLTPQRATLYLPVALVAGYLCSGNELAHQSNVESSSFLSHEKAGESIYPFTFIYLTGT